MPLIQGADMSMESLLENLLFAFVGAIAILIVIILLGVGVGYRDEIRRRGIDIYARVVITPLLLFVSAYLYLQGVLTPDTLFIAVVWVLPVIFCTDWSRLRATKGGDEQPIL
jgi:hypothetical protein